MSASQTIGFVGVGKIGMPISQNLIKNGYRVVGYRRSSLEEFEKIGGVPARSAAEVGAQADIVFSCLPSEAACAKATWMSCSRSTSASAGHTRRLATQTPSMHPNSTMPSGRVVETSTERLAPKER